MKFQKKLPMKGGKKKAKATGKPRRSLNAYNFFFGEQRQKILNERESMPSSERLSGAHMFAAMGKEVAGRWKKLSDEDKKKYEDMAAKDKVRHDTEMLLYNAKQLKQTFKKTPEHLPKVTSYDWNQTKKDAVAQAATAKMSESRGVAVLDTASLLNLAQGLASALPPQRVSVPDRHDLAISALLHSKLEAARTLELQRRLRRAALEEKKRRELGVQLWLANAASSQGLHMLRLAVGSR